MTKTFNGDQKIKLTQLVNEGMAVMHEIDTLQGGLNDTIKAVAEELEVKPVEKVAAAVTAAVEEAPGEEPEESAVAEQTETVIEEEIAKPVVFNAASPAKKELRFAEDIMGNKSNDDAKSKKKKKGTPGKERESEGPRVRKGGRRQEFDIGDDQDIE